MIGPLARPLAQPIAKSLLAGAGGGSSASPLLLDTVSGAFAAYGLRKLRNAYSGSAIRIRRSSDNTEQDIGFSGTALDTAAIASFCGAGSGYVCKWYDQTTNARDLIQATTTLQPIIFDTGVQVATNSKPAIKYVTASSHRLSTNGATGEWNFLHNGLVTWFAAIVSTAATSSGNRMAFASNNAAALGTGYWVRRTNSTNTWTINVGNGSARPISFITTGNASTSQTLMTQCINPADGTAANRAKLWQNGSASSDTNSQTATPTTSDASALAAGNNTAGDTPWDGTLQEIVFWNSDVSSSRSTIESDINTYYTIY